ncbi:MAG TPA: glycosyltransferase family 4 protein [Jatrophihabitantaceae bacterium]|nr:glycosyltransferase family 4 protein [Jatrophihabitantaceae bacterium]
MPHSTPLKTIVVTNDFPPRQGGIQSFVHAMVTRQPAGSIVVYASDYPGAAEFDAQQPFPVVRHPTGLLVPTPAARGRVVATAREHGCQAAWFGASAPLGLLAPALRSAGVTRQIASTHGHEVGWAKLAPGRVALRRIGRDCDVITYLGEYTRRLLAPAFGPAATLERLTPGVDVDAFHPGIDGSRIRQRYRLTGRPVIVCVSRLVPRKGQDALIRALPAIRRAIPGAALLVVGRGKYQRTLSRLAERLGVGEHVVFTGGVSHADLPAHFAAGDVFAMPCRTRRAGMDVEGLGMVYLEASAVGLPVLAGDSGGAPDAIQDGVTGYLVDGRDIDAISARLIELLDDPELRARFGAAGRRWVERDWRWEVVAARLRGLLDG